MLKRQRPPSPARVAGPVLDSSIVDMLEQRDPKRARLLQTSVDGIREESVKMFTEDDDQHSTPGHEHDDASLGNSAVSDSARYKSVNSVLRELHTLHQHRLLFSPPTSAVSMAFSCLCLHCHSKFSKTAYNEGDPSWSCLHMNQQKIHDTKPSQVLEESYVKGHYHNTNRFLGSLVLSRRHDTDPPVHL